MVSTYQLIVTFGILMGNILNFICERCYKDRSYTKYSLAIAIVLGIHLGNYNWNVTCLRSRISTVLGKNQK